MPSEAVMKFDAWAYLHGVEPEFQYVLRANDSTVLVRLTIHDCVAWAEGTDFNDDYLEFDQEVETRLLNAAELQVKYAELKETFIDWCKAEGFTHFVYKGKTIDHPGGNWVAQQSAELHKVAPVTEPLTSSLDLV